MVELAAACKQRGLWPFTHFNRLHVVPPLTISDDDMRTGLAIIDEALDRRRPARHVLTRPPSRSERIWCESRTNPHRAAQLAGSSGAGRTVRVWCESPPPGRTLRIWCD